MYIHKIECAKPPCLHEDDFLYRFDPSRIQGFSSAFEDT
jgi:hypothetical protein